MMRYSLSTRRTGMTLVELMIGMVMVALVMGALGAFMTGVANGWRYTEQSQHGFVLARQAELRLQKLLKGSAQLGASGNDSVLIWLKDNNKDNQLQLAELALIRHEPMRTDRALVMVQLLPVDSLLPADQPKASQLHSVEYLADANSRADFASQVAGLSRTTVLAPNVLSTRFVTVNDAVPRMQFTLTIDGPNNQPIPLLGTASLRAANLSPLSGGMP